MWLLELPSKLESDLQDLVDWGRKWPVDFIAGKTQVLSFDQENGEKDAGVGFLFQIRLMLLHLYCLICLQENWSPDLFHEVPLS